MAPIDGSESRERSSTPNNGSAPHSFVGRWRRRWSAGGQGKVAFVMSGGGPLGALQVGALRALFEYGVRPDIVVGTSVGALNAAFVAFDPTPSGVSHLEEIWRDLEERDLFPGGRFKASWARFLVRGDGVFDNSGIRWLIESRLGDVDFEDARIPLAVVATDLNAGCDQVFVSGRITDPLLASTAMPGVFPPVEIEGRLFIDGGVSNNVPIAPAVAMGAQTVYVIDSTSGNSHGELNRPIDYLLYAFSLARSRRLSVERPWFQDRVNLVTLPPVPLDFPVPFMSMAHTARLIEASYEHTRRFVERLVETAEPVA